MLPSDVSLWEETRQRSWLMLEEIIQLRLLHFFQSEKTHHWFFCRHTECRVWLVAARKSWDVNISSNPPLPQVLPSLCELLLLWRDRDGLFLHTGAAGGATSNPQQIPPLYLLRPLPHRYKHWGFCMWLHSPLYGKHHKQQCKLSLQGSYCFIVTSS